MPLQLDHLILAVNERRQSIDFYTRVVGLTYVGERAPFSLLRVTPDFVLQLAPWGTKGGDHLAFSLRRSEFEAALARIRSHAIAYGDAFDSVGNMRAPGDAEGARGPSKSVYLFDPSRHLIELTYYELGET